MAGNDSADSPRKSSPVASGGGGRGPVRKIERDGEGDPGRESVAASVRDSPPAHDLPALLDRVPDDDEERGWAALSPGLRDKAAGRIALMRRWWGAREGLSADEAAVIADVSTKRFYQMAAAWRKRPGLLAVGAYAATPPDRSTRIHPVVNAALQRHVVKVVASADDDRTVEWMRRKLEDAVKAELPERDGEGKVLKVPSPNVVRAVIVREQNRVADLKLLGESIALDCCPISWRRQDGTPHALFVLIDRGTLRIFGHALGSVDASVEGYARAAASAIDWIGGNAGQGLPWAPRTRRADVVVGNDRADWDGLLERYLASPDAFVFDQISNDKRFGSQFRKYVGERVGRVLLRPTWTRLAPPPMADGDDVYDDRDAAERVAAEIQLHNATMALERRGDGVDAPPAALLAALRFLAG